MDTLGKHDKPNVNLTSIVFSGGQKVDLNPGDRVVIVGANNSGKSQALREIIQSVQKPKQTNNLVVSRVGIEKEGAAQRLKDFLSTNAYFTGSEYRYNDWSIHASHVDFWNEPGLHEVISKGFIKNITANERLNICQPQNSISPEQPKTRPQHVLYDNSTLMQRISGLFRQAFDKDIMFDFRGGSTLPIHVGAIPGGEDMTDRVSDRYTDAVRRNPLLHQQGDGMKSYAGILFEAIVSNLDVTLIDEPEAFLHPPQMRKLGETLATEVKGQLIVSTHSSDILRGLLEGTRGSLRIIRISRDEDVNNAHEADGATVASLWQKPDLRYSNALEGIFHEQTIICEDDSDCRLINSVADHCSKFTQKQWKDTAYVPTGGKHAIPQIAKTLREIGVPVKAIFDIDFLSERTLVRSTVEAFGGIWSSFEGSWVKLDAAVRNGIKPKTAFEIKDEIMSALKDAQEDELPKSKISEALKQDKPWSIVKRHGFSGVPRGDATRELQVLSSNLESIGIYIIPAGEIENFCPEIGLHGPKYVTKLLDTISLEDDRLSALRDFVAKVHTGPSGCLKAAIQVVGEADANVGHP